VSPRNGDRLAEYRAKRDFRRTPEPAPGKAAASAGTLRFVVQKHAARRLHYDLRLEWEGALLSWAVTRGPSLDPDEKRLAVRTEDHPMSYAGFEGTIPKGEYGAGTVMLWDRGTWRPEGDVAEGLRKGKLGFAVDGQRMQGGWTLVRMRGQTRGAGPRENWLLLKARDAAARPGDPDGLTDGALRSVDSGRDLAQIRAGAAAGRPVRRGRLPGFRPVQLATLVDAAPADDGWQHETKFDGYRALAALGEGGPRLYTRSGKDWTDRFAPLVPAFAALSCASALIDGEVMAATAKGSPFSALQAALSDGGALRFFAFDLLELDGKDLAPAPLSDRRAALKALLARQSEDSPLRLSDRVVGQGPAVFAAACAQGAEGIVSKRVDAAYAGRRTRAWLKVKCGRRQEFVVGGYRPSDRPGRPFASLLLGTWEEGRLVYRGRVGSGFTDAAFRRITDSMTPRRAAPFEAFPAAAAKTARWIAPDLVAEVAFAEFTDDGHVRHARFLGLREDKPARTVTRERPAKEMNMSATVLDIEITSPDRHVFPDAGCTKLDIATHYARVGARMVTLAGHRPLSLFRCPGGLGEPCFFQKHGHGAMPAALSQVDIAEKDGGTEAYLYATRPQGWVAAAQMGTVEFHIWGARTDRLDRPDRLVFDLDPDEGLDWADVRTAAVELREALAQFGLTSGAIVTGGKGVHVWMPLKRSRDWETVKLFSKTFAHALAERAPDRYTATMSKARRKGRIFIDWLRNDRGATAIAPYSIRARTGAPVAVPVTWDELDRLSGASAFSLSDIAGRLAMPCPAAALLARPQSLTTAVIDRLGNWSDAG
jgi:bifunctional non-homologous end joining protein LigD